MPKQFFITVEDTTYATFRVTADSEQAARNLAVTGYGFAEDLSSFAAAREGRLSLDDLGSHGYPTVVYVEEIDEGEAE